MSHPRPLSRSLIAALPLVLVFGCTPSQPALRSAAVAREAGAGRSGAPDDALRILAKQAEAVRLRERAVEVELFVLDEALRDGGDGRKLPARRAALLTALDRWQREAIEAYGRWVDDPSFRRSKGRANALLELARALKDQGRIPDAMRRYGEVLAEGSLPPTVELEAHAALADLAFSSEQLDEAIRHCDAVAARGTPGQRVHALYIKAWSLRGLGESAHPGAIRESMEALREIARLGAERGVDASIVSSAEPELVELYARYGDRGTAQAFFAKAGTRAEARLLTALRARYARGEPPAPGGARLTL